MTPAGLVCPACSNAGRRDGAGSGKVAAIVIGVVVGIIALTVVMAAVVFVLVNNLGSEPVPYVGFEQDDLDNTLTVTYADEVDWGDVEVEVYSLVGDYQGCTVKGMMAGGNAYTDSYGPVAGYGTPVRANDRLQVSARDAGEVCEVMLRHMPTNNMLGSWTFEF